jgi:hypothetical protein
MVDVSVRAPDPAVLAIARILMLMIVHHQRRRLPHDVVLELMICDFPPA